MTLSQLRWAMFSHNKQPVGIHVLLLKFRDGKAIQKMLRAKLVGGGKYGFRPPRLHFLNFNFEDATEGLLDIRHYESTLGWARKVVHQAQQQVEELVGPLDAPKYEPVDD